MMSIKILRCNGSILKDLLKKEVSNEYKNYI